MISWVLNTPLKYQKLLYKNVQEKVNTYAKMRNKYCEKSVMSCKSMRNYSQFLS